MVHDEPPGSYVICDYCGWEYDIVQLVFPDDDGGPNHVSLFEAQMNYRQFGACERRCLPIVEKPSVDAIRDAEWRPLDRDKDKYLRFSSEADHFLWRSTAMIDHDACLFYWRADYWLLNVEREG